MRRLLYPLLVGGPLAGAVIALGRGVPAEAVVPAASVVTAVLLVVLERLRPYSAAWASGHGDLGTDALYGLTTALGGGLLLRVVPPSTVLGLLSRSPAVGWGLWPSRAPLLAQAALAALAMELFQYGLHRAMHRVPWLWRLHAIHHSAPRVYWLNALRMHPLDALLSSLAFAVPVLLGAGPEPLAVASVLFGVHALLQHANVQLEVGPLNWIFSSPDLHRWHHSPLRSESEGNYGGALICWDLLFRTRLAPARPPPEEVGLEALPDFPTRWLAQVLAPFRSGPWRRGPDPDR